MVNYHSQFNFIQQLFLFMIGTITLHCVWKYKKVGQGNVNVQTTQFQTLETHMCSFVQKHLLNTYYMPDIGNTVKNNKDNVPTFMELTYLLFQ